MIAIYQLEDKSLVDWICEIEAVQDDLAKDEDAEDDERKEEDGRLLEHDAEDNAGAADHLRPDDHLLDFWIRLPLDEPDQQ